MPAQTNARFKVRRMKMKMKMKKIVGHFAVASIILAFGLALMGCLGALDDASKTEVYEVGGESIPSITSLVGERQATSASSSTTNGFPSVEYTYKSSSVYDDLLVYVSTLRDDGWMVTEDIDLDVTPGSGQLGKHSSEEGQILLLDFAYEEDEYTISVLKAEGTLG